MLSRSRIVFVLAFLMSLMYVISAFAGGWSIIVLDELPVNVSAGELLIVRVSVLVIGIAGLVFAFCRKSRLAVGLTGLCLLVGIGSFVMNPVVPAVKAQSKSSASVSEPAISQVEIGRQLFFAKGLYHLPRKQQSYDET